MRKKVNVKSQKKHCIFFVFVELSKKNADACKTQTPTGI